MKCINCHFASHTMHNTGGSHIFSLNQKQRKNPELVEITSTSLGCAEECWSEGGLIYHRKEALKELTQNRKCILYFKYDKKYYFSNAARAARDYWIELRRWRISAWISFISAAMSFMSVIIAIWAVYISMCQQ